MLNILMIAKHVLRFGAYPAQNPQDCYRYSFTTSKVTIQANASNTLLVLCIQGLDSYRYSFTIVLVI
jgi:hypothetical protein